MKIRLFMVALAGIASAVLMPIAAHAASTEDFVRTASIANEFEIQSSKLALDKSQNHDIKTFAQHMIDDHTKAGNDLSAALQSSNSGVQPATQLDDKHQKLMDELQNASGDEFNRRYVSMQTDAHKKAVALFRDYAKHGKDPAVRKFAAATLPTLEGHLKHVEGLKP